MASGNLLYDARNSNLVFCENLEECVGWGGRQEEVQEGEDTCIPMADPH